MAQDTDEQSLQDTFEHWAACLNEGKADEHFAYYHDQADILDEDYPWRMSKADFQDHINFHAASNGGQGMWEFFQWIPRESKFLVVGDTGHIAGFSTFRGKPRDTGFRQRFMGFTQTWARIDGAWKLLCFHQSVLQGRIEGASPS